MLDFPSPMLAPLRMHRIDPPKVHPATLYLRQQPHAIQIIQLVEGPPPAPRRISSAPSSSSGGSSSASSSSSESESCEDEPSESESCSSYCSSDDDARAPTPAGADATYAARMKRILAWRNDFSGPAQLPGTPPLYPLHPALIPPADNAPAQMKRKLDVDVDDDRDDVRSHSSKRSRSHTGDSISAPHACPACDASFASLQGLRVHGRDRANAACSAAVDYAFEQ